MTLKEKMDMAIDYLNKTDLAAMPIGRVDLNEDIFILRQAYNSKPEEICRFESHKKYIDIQWVISGMEAIEITTLPNVEVDQPYNPDTDLEFYKTPTEVVSRAVLSAGTYMTLFPEIIHRPGLAVGESVPVEKIVAKVRI